MTKETGTMKLRIRVYLAGPISSPSTLIFLRNLQVGQAMAAELIKLGFSVYCPFLDYHLVLAEGENRLTIEELQANSRAWIPASQVMLLLPGWQMSRGAGGEHEDAVSCGLPIFTSLEDLKKWAGLK